VPALLIVVDLWPRDRESACGVRLEDLILVTEDGCENLTDFPYELDLRAA